ncbi:hypothetical protein HCZ23_06020 [Celeribacter sp. HF31]|uniref:hypothetical protein n=1 Tax=Celeribacter sp. HF31 TaxID=2721558 RepID=UPI00143162EF|nr:hypothetical protein [Celeribacter sp. HF31]NIY79022.1 hypothetical protein [Celeribacter sp. HF31]
MKTDPTVRYATLNGVADAAGFRRALLKGELGSGVLENGAWLGDTFGKLAKVGNIGTLARDIVEERLMEALPETLIFDDLERTAMTPELVFGLINDFVEHEGKRVILLVNSEKHPWKDKFLEKKEKLIGRTLRVEADMDAALPAFIKLMDEGRGKQYLKDHPDLIREVFEQAGHNNLRLLRNALREYALVLDRIEDALFEAQEPMARFTRTYLALAMALGKGEIAEEDLGRRADWKVFSPSEGEPHTFKTIMDRHQGADIMAGSGGTLSVALGQTLLGRGFVNEALLNLELRATGAFRKQEDNPLWLRMVKWREQPTEQLKDDIEAAKSYLFEKADIGTGPFLHIADNLMQIHVAAGQEDLATDLSEKCVARIHALGEKDYIPKARFGMEFGWSGELRRFSFGGYASEPSPHFMPLIVAMREQQLSRYERELQEEAEDLTLKIEEDFEHAGWKFVRNMAGPSFYDSPVLHLCDPKRIAIVVFDAISAGKQDEIGGFVTRLGERHSADNTWDDERKWAMSLRAELENLARSAGFVEQAQLAAFLEFYWKLTPPDTD